MGLPLVVRGTFTNKAFVPEEPLPDVEGRAELIIHARNPEASAGEPPSIFEVLGKAAHLRSASDLDAQLEEERSAWGGA